MIIVSAFSFYRKGVKFWGLNEPKPSRPRLGWVLLFVHRPTAGDAVVARGPSCATGSVEGAGRGHTIHPVRGTFVFVDSRSGKACDAAQAGAAIEHFVVAAIGQRSSRQRGSRGQAGAAREHAVVAVSGQLGGRQRGGRGQAGAGGEHSGVAACGQRSSRQLGGGGQAFAAIEHAGVAPCGQRGGGQQQTACVGKGGVPTEKCIKGHVLQRGKRGIVVFVQHAHDVAIDPEAFGNNFFINEM